MLALYDFYRLYAAELTLTTAALVVLLLLWVVALQWRLSRLHRRYRAAMTGASGGDLEAALGQQQATQQEHTERLRRLEAHSHALAEQLATQAGRVGIVRFNPFQDSGGDQSFSVAWVDANTTGVVISSLYSRAGVRVYAKPLDKGTSAYTLTEEEQAAIQAAKAK